MSVGPYFMTYTEELAWEVQVTKEEMGDLDSFRITTFCASADTGEDKEKQPMGWEEGQCLGSSLGSHLEYIVLELNKERQPICFEDEQRT